MCSEPDIDGYEADTSSSNNLLLDPAYWEANPEKLSLMRDHIFGTTESKSHLLALLTSIDDLESVTEPESNPVKVPLAVSIISASAVYESVRSLKVILLKSHLWSLSSQPLLSTRVLQSPKVILSKSHSQSLVLSMSRRVLWSPKVILSKSHLRVSIILAPVLAPINDLESVTEPESELDATPVHIHKPIFATPSPPPPTSIYWKYVSKEEDAAWYARSGKDDGFHAVHQIKRELQALCDSK
ncbi:hypothetical protein BDR05DRAFT_1005173 [Suillus weaverae]|nr:hypothetical protein BDR05DRAFT_1005173 [Suillus weaverae]